jgi:hypothetical protein
MAEGTHPRVAVEKMLAEDCFHSHLPLCRFRFSHFLSRPLFRFLSDDCSTAQAAAAASFRRPLAVAKAMPFATMLLPMYLWW